LEFAQAKVLHLAAEVTSFDREAPDPSGALEWKAIELAGIDEKANRELFALFLEDVLVTGDGAPCYLHLLETADPSGEDVDRASHMCEMLIQQ